MAADSFARYDRLRTADLIRPAAEAVLFALVLLSPYPFGCAEPSWTFALLAGVGLLVCLWFAHVVMTRELRFRWDGVSLGLFGLVLFTAFQTVPLPESVVGVLSPARLEQHRTLRPDVEERLPGEPPAAARPTTLTLSIDASRTRDSLVLFTAVLLLYAAARNFVFTRAAAQRLAWAAFANGIVLSTLALMQFFSSPRTTVYWSVITEGAVFGPFVCKNHYPYYLSLCIGLGLALLLQEWQKQDRESATYAEANRSWSDVLHHAMERLRSPRSVFLLGGLGFMLVSVPFSLSRGGVLAIVVAGLLARLVAWIAQRSDSQSNRSTGSGTVILLLVLTFGIGLGAWFGWKPVEERLDTLWQGSRTASSDRVPLWKDLAAAIPEFPLVGAGAGSTIHLEGLTRTRQDIAFMYYANAHNDYLEAMIEGGVVRLVLTLLIIGAVLWAAAAGYVRHHRRTSGPWLLGAFFGLTEIAVHSFGDFGMHIPAVAVFATVVAAFTMAVREDMAANPERRRSRTRIRTRRGEEPNSSSDRMSVEPRETEPASLKTPETPATVLTGVAAIFIVGSAVLAAGLVVFEAWKARLVQRWGNAAVAAAVDFDNPDRLTLAADRIAGAVNVRPDDPTLWNDLAAARLADALDRAGRAPAAAAGAAAIYFLPPETPPPELLESHVFPALRAARAARNLCPVLPGPQLRLGALSQAFAPPIPSEIYFDRAKRVAPADPDILYLSGANALAQGNRDAAFADWREGMTRSGSVLPLIVRATQRPLPPDGQPLSAEELRTKVLPDNPAQWVAAANVLYPDAAAAPPERQSLLRAAHARWTAGPPSSVPDWWTWGMLCEELRDWPAALRVFQQGFDAFPTSAQLRDRLALRLEADEQYGAALPHLEWLKQQSPGRIDLRDRLDAVHRALKLQGEIDGK